MSSFTAPAAARRPATVTTALVLLVLISLIGLVPVPADAGVPLVVQIVKAVLGVLGLVAAFGLWRTRTWAAVLAVAVAVLNILSSAPGLLAPASVRVVVAVELAICLALLVLLLPAARRAYA